MMNSITPYISLIAQGACTTFAAWLIVGTLSLLIGTVLGIVSCRYLTTRTMRTLIGTYTFIAKGIPLYVQILIAYFVMPAILGISVSGFVAATLALTFCSSGYVTEIVRSGINTIPLGQWQACMVLRYPMQATLTRIILPQAVHNCAPALMGELEQILKSTALFATIGVLELTRAGMNIISRELNPIPVYLTIACMYLLFSGILQLAVYFIKRKKLA